MMRSVIILVILLVISYPAY
ncbi:TPA: type I toxin-antitoxin system Ibs family toxin [Kluyvera georgiana]